MDATPWVRQHAAQRLVAAQANVSLRTLSAKARPKPSAARAGCPRGGPEGTRLSRMQRESRAIPPQQVQPAKTILKIPLVLQQHLRRNALCLLTPYRVRLMHTRKAGISEPLNQGTNIRRDIFSDTSEPKGRVTSSSKKNQAKSCPSIKIRSSFFAVNLTKKQT